MCGLIISWEMLDLNIYETFSHVDKWHCYLDEPLDIAILSLQFNSSNSNFYTPGSFPKIVTSITLKKAKFPK